MSVSSRRFVRFSSNVGPAIGYKRYSHFAGLPQGNVSNAHERPQLIYNPKF